MPMQLLMLLIFLLMSAFFSSAEIAYVVSNKLKIEIKSRKKNIAAESASYFIKHPQDFFPTILIGNNIVNIAFTSMSTIFLAAYFGYNDFVILLITSITVLLLGELIPKYIARETADLTVMLTALPVRILFYALYPLVKITASISEMFTRTKNVTEENINILFSRQEIQMLFVESHKSGAVDKKEGDILTRILELADQRVYEVMRPRTDIVGVEINSSINEVYDLFIESGYSKLPVYQESVDNIKGIVLAYDLFSRPEKIADIMREVLFVPDTKRSIEMLKEFSEKRISFAVAIDEFGGTAGILTMEDIIEELFGEIRDEYDTDDEICKKVADNTFVIGGKVEIDYINEKFEIALPEGDYTTLGGYITYHLGRIPQKGESVILDERFEMLILRSNQIRIELVKMNILPE